MKKTSRIAAAAVTAAMLAATFSGCGESPASSAAGSAVPPAEKGQVYFQNFKPEVAQQYEKIAKTYTDKTGVPVRVVTAAAGTYEQTLKSEMAKSSAPTIFQINGPIGYSSWKDYCADLKDTELYKRLTDQSLAIKDGEGIYGIPFAIEGYGIIYNNAIMDKYFAMDGAKAKRIDEINSYEKLKEVADDMQAKKAELGIDGVFASTSLKKGEDWRWQTHLANIPLYYEFQADKTDLAAGVKEVKFSESDRMKQIFDLYLADSTVDPKLLGSKSVEDSMAEFALGKCAMVQNGNWGWGNISGVEGNTVKETDVKMLPIYTGAQGEEKQGLCIGTENYFCINKNASEADQKASIDFLTWLYTDAEGKKFVTEATGADGEGGLGFIAPFDTFSDSEKPSDPLAKEVLAWSAKDGITNIPWNFTIFPSQNFKDTVGAKLLEYAQGTASWDDVKTTFVDQWKAEAAAAA